MSLQDLLDPEGLRIRNGSREREITNSKNNAIKTWNSLPLGVRTSIVVGGGLLFATAIGAIFEVASRQKQYSSDAIENAREFVLQALELERTETQTAPTLEQRLAATSKAITLLHNAQRLVGDGKELESLVGVNVTLLYDGLERRRRQLELQIIQGRKMRDRMDKLHDPNVKEVSTKNPITTK